jgi:uncharacterized protein (UPF0261 family)
VKREGPFYDREADEQFIEELQRSLGKQVGLILLSYPLNHPVFAQTVIEKLCKHLELEHSKLA